MLRALIQEGAMRDEERARWTKLVADFESADLSQREFAQERGLSLSNLRYWIYRLRKESLVTEPPERSRQGAERATAPEGSRLVPVRVVASAAKPRTGNFVAVAPDGLLELALRSSRGSRRLPREQPLWNSHPAGVVKVASRKT
jgi:hypothetical protein